MFLTSIFRIPEGDVDGSKSYFFPGRQRWYDTDVHIRSAADDPKDDTPDVASALRNRLKYDNNDRPFVDVFMLSHPDQDHCGGLRKHFWLGRPEDYPDDHLKRSEKRIIIRE